MCARIVKVGIVRCFYNSAQAIFSDKKDKRKKHRGVSDRLKPNNVRRKTHLTENPNICTTGILFMWDWSEQLHSDLTPSSRQAYKLEATIAGDGITNS